MDRFRPSRSALLVLLLPILSIFLYAPIIWWATSFVLALLMAYISTHFRAGSVLSSGASSIPKVRGRLPGNIDILWQLVFNENHEYCGETLRKWAEVYGPTFDMNILWGHQIVTADPTNVKHILANDFESFAKGVKFREMLDNFLGAGIFTTDGDTWKYHRAMARPFFSAERTSDFECFERHTFKALAVISDHARRDEPFDIQHLLSRFTLDTGTDFLFANSADSLTYSMTSNTAYESFSKAFDIVSGIATRRIRIGSNWRIFELGRDPTKLPMKDIHAFIEPIIRNALASRETDVDVERRSFLDHLVRSTLDVKMVRDELLNLLLASRDTTASFLTFVTYILACHPNVFQNLRDEIVVVMGEREVPTISDVKNMRYLRAVLNEVLRLFPPVPFNIRRCVKPSTLPSTLSKSGPFLITPGISVTYSQLLIQRRYDLWGQSACVFDPQRWLHEGPKTHVTDPFAFLPFNGGPRMCLGQQFAYGECSYFVIRMLKTFKTLHLAPDAQPPKSLPPVVWSSLNVERHSMERCWPAASLTLYSKGGLWIRMKI